MGRNPSRGDRRYYESALNRDSSSGYNGSLDKSLDTGKKSMSKREPRLARKPPASYEYMTESKPRWRPIKYRG